MPVVPLSVPVEPVVDPVVPLSIPVDAVDPVVSVCELRPSAEADDLVRPSITKDDAMQPARNK
jgi:hypothetical protein